MDVLDSDHCEFSISDVGMPSTYLVFIDYLFYDVALIWLFTLMSLARTDLCGYYQHPCDV